MKILVTGAAGKVGEAVARELLDAGYEVRILDILPPEADLKQHCEVVYCDLQDRIGVLRAVDGCDAIAHLAAVPNPLNGLDQTLFGPNVLGTQNIFAAMEACGVKKMVLASSCSVYGFPFQLKEGDDRLIPDYLPMDIDHPIVSQDIYALSKECNERTAAMYTRRTGMATTCLRLSMVVNFNKFHIRLSRMLEHSLNWGSRDLWGYVECRDVARAFRLSIEKVESGHHKLIICAQDVMVDTDDVRGLIERHYPKLTPFLDNGFDYDKYGFWDTRPAKELLGWESQYHWRDHLPAQGKVATK
jgi:nucleoside-diphosphate-sugar epimerase